MNLRGMFSALQEALYPNTCPMCGKKAELGSVCCNQCAKQVIPKPQTVEFHWQGINALVCHSVYPYRILREPIRQLKFHDQKFYGEPLGNLLWQDGTVQAMARQSDGLVCVPISARRKGERGYNQTRLLAQVLEKNSGIPMVDVAKKIRHTKAQSELGRKERLSNLKDAFAVTKPELVQDKKILLIDDIVTTGATLCEMAKTLYKAGAKQVQAVTLTYAELT